MGESGDPECIKNTFIVGGWLSVIGCLYRLALPFVCDVVVVIELVKSGGDGWT